MKPEELIVELQSCGANIKVPIAATGQRGGAGPADGKAFVMEGITAVVPTIGDFVPASPYAVEADESGYIVTRNGHKVASVSFPETPKFYHLTTKDGIPYWKIALLHGTDVLATTVVQVCVRWNSDGERCKFCGIGISLAHDRTIAVKTPEQLAEVAEAAVRLDGVRHFVMTTGTTNYADKGVGYLARCATAVKQAVDLPIQAQFEPPEDLEVMLELKEARVESVGIHLESFDQKIRNAITPGKAQISLERYLEAYRRAVQIFGENQVSSYIIVGLGEDPASIIEGCKRLVDMGVYPFLVPLRPILGTSMEGWTPPSPEQMSSIYREVTTYMARRGMSWQKSKAGCVRCGACSALPAFQR
jgi:radical SAM protein (TIGR04043 family)